MTTIETYPCGCDSKTAEDVAGLLKLEESFSKEEGWEKLCDEKGHEIWRKNDHHTPDHLVKGFLEFKNIPSESILDIITDLEARKKWDKHFTVIEVLESLEHCRTVYWECKMPLGVSARDTVQRICTHYDEETKTTFIKSFDATHPSKPEVKGVVRTKTILSGIIVRPHPDDPKSTRVTLLMQIDMKGKIPHTIANIFIGKAPVEWQESVCKYYWDDYSKNKAGCSGESKHRK